MRIIKENSVMKSRRNKSSSRARKISASDLRKLVLSEAKKLQESNLPGNIDPVEDTEAEEDVWGSGEALELDIDYIKALKIQETKLNDQHKKLVRRMRKLQERKAQLRKKIIKNI